jgi:hypothetical protein
MRGQDKSTILQLNAICWVAPFSSDEVHWHLQLSKQHKN